jgi:hypothetical protein
MNRDAEIANLMLWGHLGLTLIALGAAFTGIYVAMESTIFSIETSLPSTATSTGYLHFGQVMTISSLYLVFSIAVMFIGGVIFAVYVQKLKKLGNNHRKRA